MKRKQADSDGTFPPSKRRRCNTLEHGLAGLSIASERAIEEAVAPEIKMKTSSWYEPEPDRIVVTDLDSSDDEDGGTEVLTITPAYLKHIQTRIPRPLAGPPSGVSQAVVLYQPVAPPPKRDRW
ncbi:hypothetical protein BD779DRAFT_1670638 [Infundibulicybe gibba]|nr:hypothetical protein BD779DRAFT_1670638 [Infundibulicybe gibba]